MKVLKEDEEGEDESDDDDDQGVSPSIALQFDNEHNSKKLKMN